MTMPATVVPVVLDRFDAAALRDRFDAAGAVTFAS